MTDEELLEWAAKGAHVEGKLRRIQMPYSNNIVIGIGKNRWNPLESDADAFRLAVKLNLFEPEIMDDWEWCKHKFQYSDVCANYRRAITIAAAKIGKETK